MRMGTKEGWGGADGLVSRCPTGLLLRSRRRDALRGSGLRALRGFGFLDFLGVLLRGRLGRLHGAGVLASGAGGRVSRRLGREGGGRECESDGECGGLHCLFLPCGLCPLHLHLAAAGRNSR